MKDKTLKRALLSVSDKTGIVELARELLSLDFQIVSTGGTARALTEAEIPVTEISEITEFPECLGGRVKTLNPLIFGGILNIRSNPEHQKECQVLGIENIDLVCVNLYPFESTVESGADFQNCIENIDIGGPSLIRAAAKNFQDVLVITSPDQYEEVVNAIRDNKDDQAFRLGLALEAFNYTAYYDSCITRYLERYSPRENLPEKFSLGFRRKQELRYGENPVQAAAFYSSFGDHPGTLIEAQQLQGKELSYNNINDTDAAIGILKEFRDEPTIVAVKHANPCGIASRDNIYEAFIAANEADPTSIFGGIIASNREIDQQTAREMSKIFLEVIVAPDFTDEALEVFSEKPNLRLLKLPDILERVEDQEIKSVMGGVLLQEPDTELTEELKTVTRREPTERELEDLIFAYKAVKHTKSNAISLVKDKTLIANGPGQVNRIWPTEYSIRQAGDKVKGAVLASDAFFPFDDCVRAAAEAGITAIIQPGGSVRDQDSIDRCDENDITMVFTNMRHFKHN